MRRRLATILLAFTAVSAAAAPASAVIGRSASRGRHAHAGEARRSVRSNAVVYYPYAYPVYVAPEYPEIDLDDYPGATTTVPPGCIAGEECDGVVYQPYYTGTEIVYLPVPLY